MIFKRKWLLTGLMLGFVVLFSGCSGDLVDSFPDYTVTGLPAPEDLNGSLIWSDVPGGSIVFDNLLTSTTSVTFTVSATLWGTNDYDGSGMVINVLDEPNQGSQGIEVGIQLDPVTTNTINLDINEVATNLPCPTQVITDTLFTISIARSFTVKVEQSGTTPVVSVWLTGDPSVDTASYTSDAADCTTDSATWVISEAPRVHLAAWDLSITSASY